MMGVCAGMTETLLSESPTVVNDIDEDLLYGFDLSITEDTLRNFESVVGVPHDLEEDIRNLWEEYEDAVGRRESGVMKLWNASGVNRSKGWRLCADNIEESETENEFRHGHKDCTFLELDKIIKRRFDACVCEDNPQLAFEYQGRVRDLQMGIRAPKTIILRGHQFREFDLPKEWNWQFHISDASAFMDSGVLLEFYADSERSDLLKNLGTCAYFDASVPFQNVAPHSAECAFPVNPWTWMVWWLNGYIDGVEWKSVGRGGVVEDGGSGHMDIMTVILNSRRFDPRDIEPDELKIGSFVRARFGYTDHFLPGTITNVLLNIAKVKFTHDDSDLESYVNKRDIIPSVDPRSIGTSAGGNLYAATASWYTHHMRGIRDDLAETTNLVRFTEISVPDKLRGIDYLSMLMMDAFREEVHRQCQRSVDSQLAALQRWFASQSLVMCLGDALVSPQNAVAFVDQQYRWHEHASLKEHAVADIIDRRRRAQLQCQRHTCTRIKAIAPKAAPSSEEMEREGVFKLIDDVTSTRMRYKQIAKKCQVVDTPAKIFAFPHDWSNDAVDLPNEVEKTLIMRGLAKYRVKALRMTSATDKECVLASIVWMQKFERVRANTEGALVVCTPRSIRFKGCSFNNEERFSSQPPLFFDVTSNTSRVAHGEYTYDVLYDSPTDPSEGGFHLHACMLAPEDSVIDDTFEENRRVGREKNAIDIMFQYYNGKIREVDDAGIGMRELKNELNGCATDDDRRALLQEWVEDMSDKLQQGSPWARIDLEMQSYGQSETVAEWFVGLGVMLDSRTNFLRAFEGYLLKGADNSAESIRRIVAYADDAVRRPRYEGLEGRALLQAALDAILTRKRQTWLEVYESTGASDIVLQKCVDDVYDEVCIPAAKRKPSAAAAAKAAAAKAVAAKAAATKAAAAKAAAAAAAEAKPKPNPAPDEDPDAVGGPDADAVHDFFTHCNAWLFTLKEDHDVNLERLSSTPAAKIRIGSRVEKDADHRLVEMISIGVNFARHFGREIPTPDYDAGDIRASAELEADMRKVGGTLDLTTLFRMYRTAKKGTDEAFISPRIVWMLRRFPSTPAGVNVALQGDAGELLTAYRTAITYAQCQWLVLDLIGFCASGALTTSALLEPGKHPFQDNILEVMHRSADDHNYTGLAGYKFTLAEAVWLSLHVNNAASKTPDALREKVQVHCRYEYGRLKDDAARTAYQAKLETCKTPGQLLRCSAAEVEMPVAKYPYHARPLFPNVVAGKSTSAELRNAVEFTEPGKLKKAQPSPYAAFLRLQDEAFCGLKRAVWLEEKDFAVLYPTRRPWTQSRGLAIRLVHLQAFRDRWPAHWHTLRDQVPVHVWMQVPSCVSSMHYLKTAGVRKRGKRRKAKRGGADAEKDGAKDEAAKSDPEENPAGHLAWPKIGSLPLLPGRTPVSAKHGGLFNRGMNCWLNTACQFLLRGDLGKRVMRNVVFLMRKFWGILSDVSQGERGTIMKFAQECSMKAATAEEYAEMPLLHTFHVWVLFLVWGKHRPSNTNTDTLLGLLLRDRKILTYTFMELWHTAYVHINSSKKNKHHVSVIQMQHVLYLLNPNFRCGTQFDLVESVTSMQEILVEFQLRGLQVRVFADAPQEDFELFMRGDRIGCFDDLLATYTQTITCEICGNKSIKSEIDPFPIFSIANLKRPEALSSVFARCYEDEKMTGDGSYECEVCLARTKKKSPDSTKSKHWDFADFVAFRENCAEFGNPKKLTSLRHLRIHKEMTLEGHQYRLVGIARHYGSGASHGHYDTFVNDKGKWFHINDETVEASTFANAVSQNAKSHSVNLILYEKVKKGRKEEEEEEEEEEEDESEKDEEDEEEEEEEDMDPDTLLAKRVAEEAEVAEAVAAADKQEAAAEKKRAAQSKKAEAAARRRLAAKKKGAPADVVEDDELAEALRLSEQLELDEVLKKSLAAATPAKKSEGNVKYKKVVNGVAIEVVFGQITDAKADAVVNAANGASFKVNDSGISGALRDLMYTERRGLLLLSEQIYEDATILTSEKTVYFVDEQPKPSKNVQEYAAGVQNATGQLLENYKHVIHAVGPEWKHKPTSELNFSQDKVNLDTTIRSVFYAANALRMKSIVFCVISGGLFCHDDKSWSSREKTAARDVLVDAIYRHAIGSDRDSTWRIQRIVIFEYDTEIAKDKREAARRLQETIDLLTKKCGEGDPLGEAEAAADVVDADEAAADVVDVEDAAAEVAAFLEMAAAADAVESEEAAAAAADVEPRAAPGGSGARVRMPWTDAAAFKRQLGKLPTWDARTEHSERTKLMLTWVKEHPILLKYFKSLKKKKPDDGRPLFWKTMEHILIAVKHIPENRKRHLETIVDQEEGDDCETVLTSIDVRTLMACAFLGLFEFDKDQHLQFHRILTAEKSGEGERGRDMRSEHKVACIWNYFEQAFAGDAGPERDIRFVRGQGGAFSKKIWQTTTAKVKSVHVHNLNAEEEIIGIEDMCDTLDGDCWEVDFANKGIGGGVIGSGALQEEIRFLECPELIVCKLFMKPLEDNECVRITGYRQFNDTTGYSSNHEPKFAFDKKHPKAAEPQQERKMIVMDAEYHKHKEHEQFGMAHINRDLHKAYTGFCAGDGESPIVTGHWGCGDYGGDNDLKFLIQVMAAGMAGKNLEYCVFGQHEKELRALAAGIAGMSVAALYTALQTKIGAVLKHEGTLDKFKDAKFRAIFFRALYTGHAVEAASEVVAVPREVKKAAKLPRIPKTKAAERVEAKIDEVVERGIGKKIRLEEPAVAAAHAGGNWFHENFGFHEQKTGNSARHKRADWKFNAGKFLVDDDENLVWKDDNNETKKQRVGSWSIRNVDQLMKDYAKRTYNIVDGIGYNDDMDELTFAHACPPGGVRALIMDPNNANAVFMVASQFNALEMISPESTPGDGVTIYSNDPTQGPACAMACPAATVWRNYCVSINGSHGQNEGQIDLLDRVAIRLGNAGNAFWHMKNGYMLPNSKAKYEAMEALIENTDGMEDALTAAVKVGVHFDTQVALPAKHLVTQVFCSALPVAYFGHDIASIVDDHHRLARCVLCAAYKATLAVAAHRAAHLKKTVTVYLTALGGGAFGNQTAWIKRALTDAMGEFHRAPLRVVLVHYETISTVWSVLQEGTYSQRRARALRWTLKTEERVTTYIGNKGRFDEEVKCSLCANVGTGYTRVHEESPRVAICGECIRLGVTDVDEGVAQRMVEKALNDTHGNKFLIKLYTAGQGTFADEASCAKCGAVGEHFVRVHKKSPRVALCHPCLKTGVS